MGRLLRNRAVIVGLAAAVLVITAVRLVVHGNSQLVTLEGLAFGVTLGVLLAVIQRMLTIFAERRSGDRETQPYRLVRTFSLQLAFAFAFSLFIGSPIVLGYVAGAAIMLINLALRYEPETSIDERP